MEVVHLLVITVANLDQVCGQFASLFTLVNKVTKTSPVTLDGA